MADVALHRVEKRFGREQVVKSIDLDIRDGEFFSLLGPSGCGKTTTLRMIAGLEQASAGDILIGGARVNDVPINRRPTNLVFQKMALFPHLDVFENVAFGLRLKKLPRSAIGDRVAQMLEVVNLSGFEGRAVTQLSGGQQQRVAIARALVNEPAVLLLDEPLGALDLKLQLHLQRELRRIQRATGTTFIHVTHNQAEALVMSDRLAVMNGGQIEQVGTPSDMYLRPATSFVASFIGRSNLIEASVITSGAETVLRSGLMEFRLAVPVEGQSAVLSLRPERIRIGAEGLEAVVTEVEFTGASVLYRMRLVDGVSLLVQALADRPPHAHGAAVRLSWDADAAVPIRANTIAQEDA